MEAVAVDLGGQSPIHALVTKKGIMFSMSQVAVEVFGENPAAFGKELRRLRYPRVRTLDTVTLMRLAQLGIPPESANVTGATLLPPNSLLRILDDRRRIDLIPKVRAAMLQMITKEVTDLIIRGQFETALPIAMDAVAKAQALYWPREPLRMVPCYLLAVKVNLGLNRPVQSEDLLGVGSWLLLQDKTDEAKDDLRSEISQLFGRLSMLNKLNDPSLKAYAEEIYYKSREFGIYDVRTSIAFYNISRVFHHENQVDHVLAFWDVVIHSWKVALEEVILGVKPSRELPWGKREFEGKNPDHLGPKEAIATLQMPEVCDMLQTFARVTNSNGQRPFMWKHHNRLHLSLVNEFMKEICKFRSDKLGRDNLAVGEACYVTGLAFNYANKKMLALEHLQRAHEIMQQPNFMDLKDFIAKAIEVLLQPPPQPFLTSSPASPTSPANK